MADDPTTSGISNLTNVFAKLKQELADSYENFKKLTAEASNSASGGLKAAEQGAKGAAAAIGTVAEKAGDTSKAFNIFGSAADKVFESIKDLTAANVGLISAGTQSAMMLKMLGDSSGKASEKLFGLGEEFKNATSSASGFSDVIGKAIKQLPGIGEHAATAYSNFISVVDATKQLENKLISAAQAGGNFYDIMGSGGQSFVKDMDETMGLVISNSTKTANLLGINFQEGLKRTVAVLETLPGEFNKVYDDVIVGNKSFALKTEQILSMAARGTGKSYEDAMQIAQNVVQRFGESGLDAATRLSVLNKAAMDTKIPFKDLNELVTGLDSTFAMYGNQMMGVVDVLSNVSQALKDSNIGFKGQIDIVKSLGDAVNGMNLPMKAFIGISSQMRSAGGMVGVGLNVERMLQEGKMGEVVQMMQDTLQKKTGRGAVSLEEATDNPGAQRAFMIQRQMLQTMGVSDAGKANRILEAMSKAELGMSGAVSAESALSDALTKGDELAARQTDVMATAAQNFAAATEALKGISDFYKEYRGATGTEGESLLGNERMGNTETTGGQLRQRQLGFDFEAARKDFDVKGNAESAGLAMTRSSLAAVGQHVDLASNVFAGSFETIASATQDASGKISAFGEGALKIAGDIRSFGATMAEKASNLSDTLFEAGTTGTPNLSIPRTNPDALGAVRGGEAAAGQSGLISFEPVTIKLDLNILDNGKVTTSEVVNIAAEINRRGNRTNAAGIGQ